MRIALLGILVLYELTMLTAADGDIEGIDVGSGVDGLAEGVRLGEFDGNEVGDTVGRGMTWSQATKYPVSWT